MSHVCPCRNFPPVTVMASAASSSGKAQTATTTTTSPAAKVLCSSCVEYRLENLRERRRRILQERNHEREVCRKQLEESPLGPLVELQEQVQWKREKAEALRQECAQRAVDVARQSCENDERRQQIEMAQRSLIYRPYLSRLQASLLDGGSLDHALQQGRQQVRLLRFEWAKRAFLMHRLDVTIPSDNGTPSTTATAVAVGVRSSVTTSAGASQPKIAKGIGKIGGLPLPHAGAELYGVLPPKELESALRLVASVTSLVASCLGIVLPHPILLQSSSSASAASHDLAQDTPLHSTTAKSAAAAAASSQTTTDHNKNNYFSSDSNHVTAMPSLAASTASLANLMGETAKNLWSGATTSVPKKNPLLLEDTPQSMVIPPSTDSNVVKERVRHASAAILAEDASTGSRYSLAASVMAEDQYATALQLLQNDVVILCIRAGVPVGELWPAQAVLLNLQALYNFCKLQTREK